MSERFASMPRRSSIAALFAAVAAPGMATAKPTAEKESQVRAAPVRKRPMMPVQGDGGSQARSSMDRVAANGDQAGARAIEVGHRRRIKRTGFIIGYSF